MMRDLINILDTVLQEATLSPGEITKYPERFDAFIAHIQNNKPFYTEKEGTEVVLAPTEAARFLKMKATGEFHGSVKAVDTEGNQWPLSSFRKTAEFGGSSAKPGTVSAPGPSAGATPPPVLGIVPSDEGAKDTDPKPPAGPRPSLTRVK